MKTFTVRLYLEDSKTRDVKIEAGYPASAVKAAAKRYSHEKLVGVKVQPDK